MEERIITWSGFVFHLRGATLKDRFDWKSLHGKTLSLTVNINQKTSKPKHIRQQRWSRVGCQRSPSYCYRPDLNSVHANMRRFWWEKEEKYFSSILKKGKFLPIVHVFLCVLELIQRSESCYEGFCNNTVKKSCEELCKAVATCRKCDQYVILRLSTPLEKSSIQINVTNQARLKCILLQTNWPN